MVRQFTQDEIDSWLRERERAKVSLACKLILRDTEGNVLLVKPHHKEAWQFPGGAMEMGENPKLSVLREAKEEVGIALGAHDVRLLDTVMSPHPQVILLMYEAQVRLSKDEPLTYQNAELQGYEFVKPTQVMQHVERYYEDFWRDYLHNSQV
jgi:8-oxo-dGTP diphosphatase